MAVALKLRHGFGAIARKLHYVRLTPFDTDTAEGRVQERMRRAQLTTLCSMTSKGISVLTQLASIPLALHHLGAERYGIWMVLSTFVIMLTFADFGIGNGILNQIAKAQGSDDDSALRTITSSGFLALSAIALAVITVFFVVSPHVDWGQIFNVHAAAIRGELSGTMTTFACLFALSIPATLVQRIQIGLQQGYIAAAWQSVGNLAILPALALVIKFDGGLAAFVGVFVGAPILSNLINSLTYFLWKNRTLRPTISTVSRKCISEALHQGLGFVAIQAGNSVISSCVPIVITRTLGPEYVAQYTVPERLLALVVMLSAMYVQPLWPAYREALARGDREWVSRSYRQSIYRLLPLAVAMLVLLSIAMPLIMKLWLNSKVVSEPTLIAGICVYKVLEIVIWINSMLLNAFEKLKAQSVMALVGAAAMLGILPLAAKLHGIAAIPWTALVILLLAIVIPGSMITKMCFQSQK